MPRLTAIRKQALDDLMKKALFDATVAVLREHGAKGLTMDRVAFAAGVAKGSLYHYFRSKRDLVEFVYAKTIDPLFQDLEQLIASDRPAIEKLSRHVHALLEHVAAYAEVFKVLFEDDTAHGLLQSSERSRCEAAGERMAEIFSQGIAEGAFRPADPLMLAKMFLGMCRGIFDRQLDLDSRERRENVQHLLLGAFLNGIATEKGRGG